MMPKEHSIYGAIMGTLFLILYLIFSIINPEMYQISIKLLIIIVPLFLAVTILIDIDHPLYYIFKMKSINIKRIISCCRYGDDFKNSSLYILVFHNVEVLGVLLILTMVYPQFQLIFIVMFLAILTHLILDWIVVKDLGYNPIAKISLIGVIVVKIIKQIKNKDDR